VLLKQVMGFVPGALLPAVVTLGSTVIFTRIFGSEEFGRYTLAVSVATLLTTLAIQWVQQGTGRWLPGAHASGEGVRLKESIGAIMIGACAVLALLCSAAILLLGSRLPPVWRPMLWPGAALVLGAALFEPLLVVFQSEMRARRYSAFKAIDVSLRLALGLALVLFATRAPQSLLWGNALAPLVLFPLLWRDARMPPLRAVLARFGSLGPDLRRIAGYGVPLVGWFVASYTLNVSDRYIIQLFRGAGEVGIYSANYSLAAGAGGLMTAPVLLAVHPLLMRAWDAGRPEVAQRWLGVIVEWFIVAGVLVVGVLALFSADVARLLLGPEFREGHLVLPIAMAGAVAWQLGLYAQKPLEFAGRVRTVLAISVVAAASNVAINLVMVPRFGYLAAAYATLASYSLYAVLAALAGRRVLRWAMRWKELAGTLLLSGAGLGAAWAARALVAPSAGEGAGLLAAVALVVPTLALVATRMVKPLLGKG
jgi:O-antigen/teichoic acid export membrane protein